MCACACVRVLVHPEPKHMAPSDSEPKGTLNLSQTNMSKNRNKPKKPCSQPSPPPKNTPTPTSKPNPSNLPAPTPPPSTPPGSEPSPLSSDKNATADRSNSESATFALIAAKTPKISKDLAILFDSVDGLSIREYIDGLEQLIPVCAITFASRISQGRVCFYLSEMAFVNKIVDEAGGIQVGERFIPARRLVLIVDKLILSNVTPTIPHDTIIEALRKFAKPASSMIYMGLYNDARLSHIKSFRRQIYIERSSIQIPDSFLVNFEGEEFRIFTNSNNQTKSGTKQIQNRLKNVSLQDEPNEIEQQDQPDPASSSLSNAKNTVESESKTQKEKNKKTASSAPIEISPQTEKNRSPVDTAVTPLPLPSHPESPASSVMTSVNEPMQAENSINPKTDQKRKRNKTPPVSDQPRTKEAKKEKKRTQEENSKLKKAVTQTLHENPDFSLKEADVLDILANTKNQKKPLEIVNYYTNDHKLLADFLTEVTSQDLPRALKNRLKRLVSALQEDDILSTDENLSDSSTS